MGTAGPITFLKKKDFNNKPMIVMNADLVTNINFSELLDYFLISGNIESQLS